ncbi:hypothetical protein [Candidatus Rickettsia colombianensi]|uniref:hypothetical protein n=1 Tax=Candidatus Rickettsia colombianensi TaxID=1090944 RepID=UPI0015A9D8AB|nr:hypothetical protein [Candidatus Rickettsia colombianensi]
MGAVEEAKKILIEENLLDKAILDMKLKHYQVTDNVESNKEEKKYYKEALEWLDKLTGP